MGVRFSLPVTVVVLAISYIYFSTIFIYIERWFGLLSSPGIMNAVVFTGVAAMCVFNYTIALLMDPGRVPATYMPDIEDSESPVHEIKRKVQSQLLSWFWWVPGFISCEFIGNYFLEQLFSYSFFQVAGSLVCQCLEYKHNLYDFVCYWIYPFA